MKEKIFYDGVERHNGTLLEEAREENHKLKMKNRLNMAFALIVGFLFGILIRGFFK